MNRYLSSMLIPLASLLASASIASAADTQQPNIVFILADDLGYTDLATYGSKYYETPHIDRLAQSGVKFLSHHHCQNCQPTRAAIMTGQYAPRTGVYTVGGTNRFDSSSRPLIPVENVVALPLDRATIANQLKAAGYTTGMFGKWHLGNGPQHHASVRGFDEAIESSGKHFDFVTTPKTEHADDAYLADFLTDRAVDFIERHQAKPFFLYLPHFGVHTPLQAKQDYIKRFEKKQPAGGHNNPTYAAMIASVDDSVGRILDTLDKLKLSDNTIVIFASDNGGVGGYFREGINRQNADITDNTPLRSGKGSLYEGGTRVPLIVKWPGVTPAASETSVPTIHVDLFATLLDLAGAPQPKHVIDGASLVPLLKDPTATLSREAIYQHFPGYLGAGGGKWRTTPVSLIQMGDWKLMEFLEEGRLELYNLADDVGETQNLADSQPEKAKELHAKLIAWRTAISAKMPERKAAGADSSPPKPDTPKTKGKGKGKKAKAKASP